ncbi:MAG: hypothetical protein ACOYEK_06360, partial [bacterium]
ILRRRRHPCLKLTATATFTARDFHPRDSAHAGRTEKVPLSGTFADDILLSSVSAALKTAFCRPYASAGSLPSALNRRSCETTSPWKFEVKRFDL